MAVNQKEQIVLRTLSRGPLTVDEFVTTNKLYVNSWAPTFTHLRKEGLIRRTGEKRATAHGSEAHVLEITTPGLMALAREENAA